MNHYDILVIGGGPGGMGAALRAAELGRKTALVERAELGGVCLNWGCIPTKALLKSAQVYHYCRTADAFGVTLGGEAKPDMARIVARSRGVSETMRKGVGFLLEKNKVDVWRGEARLAGEGRVIVADETVSADHIILATGARPREMPFMPIDHEHVLSSRDALVLDELPESMVVVGSGAIGCEFASFYAALGVRVTVVEYLPQLMPLEDEEVARTMERAFRKQRIAVMTSTTVKSVTVDGEGRCRVRIEGKKGEEELTADKVLSAVGIKSNIEGLGLEELGVRVERDKIAVDEHYRTNVEGVYAVGDIVPDRHWPTSHRPKRCTAWNISAASNRIRWITRSSRRVSSLRPRWRRSATSARRWPGRFPIRWGAIRSWPRARLRPPANATAS